MNDCETERKHFKEGIELFNRGMAYESHEEFEHVWLKSKGKKKLFLQILILIAAVEVHRAKGRIDTARRVLLTIEKKLIELGNFSLHHLDQDALQILFRGLEKNEKPKIPQYPAMG